MCSPSVYDLQRQKNQSNCSIAHYVVKMASLKKHNLVTIMPFQLAFDRARVLKQENIFLFSQCRPPRPAASP